LGAFLFQGTVTIVAAGGLWRKVKGQSAIAGRIGRIDAFRDDALGGSAPARRLAAGAESARPEIPGSSDPYAPPRGDRISPTCLAAWGDGKPLSGSPAGGHSGCSFPIWRCVARIGWILISLSPYDRQSCRGYGGHSDAPVGDRGPRDGTTKSALCAFFDSPGFSLSSNSATELRSSPEAANCS